VDGAPGETGATGPSGPTGPSTGIVVPFLTSILPNTIQSANDCSIGSNNFGTANSLVGQPQYVTMDSYTQARIIYRASRNGAQTGNIQCRIQNLTDATTLVTGTAINSAGCQTIVSTATFTAVTGVKKICCQCADTVNNDDPTFAYCSVELLP
jgi:hypothetical protein